MHTAPTRWALLALVCGLAACRARSIEDRATPRASAGADTPLALDSGQSDFSIEVEGTSRAYRVIIGPKAKAAAAEGGVPLIFAWHGFSSSVEWHTRHADEMLLLWPEAVFVVPEGLPRTFERFGARPRPGWQTQAGEYGDRDLLFFDAMLAELRASLPVDDARIYSTGMSNGGFFSQLLACERPEVLAAVAPVAGAAPTDGLERCASPVPIRVIHGLGDHIVSPELAGRGYAHWLRVNGCASSSAPEQPGCLEAQGCAAATEYCAHRGGHRWPPEANEEVVEFLRLHARGG